ncbi:MAG: hypothetical protein KF897_01560 [Opitutaceae bacterium]|nr:hypothetical protein [Opitutaceae bacterium]
MAWRIDEWVLRGEIDNRVRESVTGRLWFTGRAEPVELRLAGNCWRDLAGRRLEFFNPQSKLGLPADFSGRQEGVVGDLTASRKVKVPEVSMEELMDRYRQRKPFPWHWGNSLYLEWFSMANGRVVIESVGYELKIIGESAWEMTPEEEMDQRRANGAALTDFMGRLGKALQEGQATDDEEQERPQTEEEAERMQERSDRLADRVAARLAREGEGTDYASILDEEIERMRQECGEPEPTPEQQARHAEWIEEANRAAEAAMQHPDPELELEKSIRHPLVERARDLSDQIRVMANDCNLIPADASEEHPVVELQNSIAIAAAKMAGVLGGRTWPPSVDGCAGVIVRLKRARVYLDDALRAAESCQEEKLVLPQHLGPITVTLVDLGREADVLIADLRARLARGLD